MKDELEPLKYSTLVPGRYVVYVHPREFERIRNYTDILREETARALDEELARLNRAPIWRQYLEPVLGGGKAYRNPLGDWQIEFHEDPDGDLAEGDVMIEAEKQGELPLTRAGTIDYFCRFHPGMTGKITVK